MTRFIGNPLKGIAFANAGDEAISVRLDGDNFARVRIDAGGRITWSSGSISGDTVLYRDSADLLKTDDAFQAAGGVITLTTAGAPTATLADGAIAVDTTNDAFYFRSNSTWQQVTGGGGASVTVSDTAPASPDEGDLWYESDTGDIYVYYDGVWVDVGGASVANIAMSDTAPSNPVNGDFWFETDTARTFVYYDDGTSTQWVEVGAASASLPIGDLSDVTITSATAGDILVYDGTDWINDNTVYVDTVNGYVGIGTTTPSYALEVAGSTYISQDAEVDGTLTANHIHGNLAGSVYIHVKNTSGSSITAGSPVYATGSVGASGATEIAASDASTASTMPALGILQETLADNAEGHATILGVIGSINTAAYAVNTSLYVAPGGGLTSTRPTASSDLVQKIGRVIRSDASTGEILVLGAGRTNDIPNDITLGSDTIGDYVESLVAGTGITLTNNSGEGATPTIEIGQSVGTTDSVIFNLVTANLIGNVTGNSSTASALQTARSITLGGDLSGSALFDGSADITISATINADSVALGTDTTGDYVESLVAGTGITLTNNSGEGATPTIEIGQDVATTANVTFNDVIISGNLTVSGSTTTVDTATLSVEDPLIILASGNGTTDVVDIGFYGLYDTSGSQDLYAGLFRDATDGKFRLFTDSQTAPTTTVDTAATGYTVASLVANIEGSLTGNADSADILSTARTFTLSGDVSGSVSFDGSADVTISTTIQADSVALGTDTTGDYVESLVAGTGVTLANNSGEGATPTIEIGQSVSTTDDVTFNTVTGTNGVITLTSSGAPTSTLADGAIAIDTTNNILYFRSGSSWQQVSGGVEISDAPPSSANEGDLWWESDTGRLKVYYNDGTSTQWVDAFTSGAGSASSGALLWTQFYYDGATGPAGSTTGTLGENHGTWYEATAANYANTSLGSNSSADDPTLTGITYSSGTGRFTGFPQGVYQVSFTGNVAIDATGLTISQQKGVDISGNGIFVDFPINILPEAAYHSYPNFETGFSMSTTVVMHNATPANNYLEVSAGTQNTWYYAYYGYLSITKIG